MIREVSALLFLALSGISDLRKKSIPLYLPLAGMLLAAVISFCLADMKYIELLQSIVPGLVFLVISFATSGKVGLGDGVTIIALGLLCGIWDTITTLVYSTFASGFVALFLLVAKKKSKNYTMPYLPFLLCGLVFTFLVKRIC